MTTPTDPNDLPEPKESIQNAVAAAQEKTRQAIQSGQNYVRENPVPVVVGALLAGLTIGALLAPRSRKPADPVQSVRVWLQDSLDDLSGRLPKVKEKACGFSHDVCDQVSEIGRKLKFW